MEGGYIGSEDDWPRPSQSEAIDPIPSTSSTMNHRMRSSILRSSDLPPFQAGGAHPYRQRYTLSSGATEGAPNSIGRLLPASLAMQLRTMRQAANRTATDEAVLQTLSEPFRMVETGESRTSSTLMRTGAIRLPSTAYGASTTITGGAVGRSGSGVHLEAEEEDGPVEMPFGWSARQAPEPESSDRRSSPQFELVAAELTNLRADSLDIDGAPIRDSGPRTMASPHPAGELERSTTAEEEGGQLPDLVHGEDPTDGLGNVTLEELQADTGDLAGMEGEAAEDRVRRVMARARRMRALAELREQQLSAMRAESGAGREAMDEDRVWEECWVGGGRRRRGDEEESERERRRRRRRISDLGSNGVGAVGENDEESRQRFVWIGEVCAR